MLGKAITCQKCQKTYARTTVRLVCDECLTRPCAVCRAPFVALFWHAVTCSPECYRRYKWITERTNPRRVAANRAVNRRWCAIHRKATVKPNPWLVGQPPFSPILPGWQSTITIEPAPKTPPTPGTSYGLHGALSRILGKPHMAENGADHRPNFVLLPRGRDWSVHWLHPSALDELPRTGHDSYQDEHGQVRPVTLYGARRTLHIGMPVFVPAPQVRRGRKQVRITSITPILIRATGQAGYARVLDGPKLVRALSMFGRNMLGMTREDTDLVRLNVLDITQNYERVHSGTHFGSAVGISFQATIEGNAPARWLLKVASVLGLGGRVSLGFGQIMCEDLP